MATPEEEANQDALGGLPDNERKETQEILDEIEKGAAAPIEPKDEEKPEDKPDEPAKPEDKPAPDGKPEDKKPEARREVKLMPAWVHEVAKKDFEKKIADLTKELEAKGKPADGEDAKLEEDEIKAIAEKHGYSEDFVKDVLKLADKSNGKLPADIAEKLKDVDALKAKGESEAEEKQFNSDFDSKILPLIKAEYGDDVPQGTIDDLKEDFKAQAYSDEYAKVPYEVIYKGSDAFRGVITPKKKGAEGSRGGTVEADGGSADDLDLSRPLSNEQIIKLSDADFDTYSKNMEKHEKSTKKS